ncbi:guanyl-specific ribonuclease pgl-1-like [Macrosteles quadrilineatus]|uniref:guanyl-specific ribonuclease pgl-1-like n=1 Tax=Macrosteles quadrilineatus TaxID=74068 RepID=UPI0023E2E7C1|nr:guanyl-specific ribonuclease pgl-1-like [Macrosteles quadrilineatus]
MSPLRFQIVLLLLIVKIVLSYEDETGDRGWRGRGRGNNQHGGHGGRHGGRYGGEAQRRSCCNGEDRGRKGGYKNKPTSGQSESMSTYEADYHW